MSDSPASPASTTRVTLLTPDMLQWDFNGSHPRYTYSGYHEMSTRVDPFPAYHHDVALVTRELAHCAEVFPIPQPVSIFILSHESLTRTNGDTSIQEQWNEKKARPNDYRAVITFSAKRTPIHPAYTRYLVAHEYGHAIEPWLAGGQQKAMGRLQDEYRELRGIHDPPESYGGGNWHRQIQEIMANDFRIIVAQREMEWWPHDGESPAGIFHGPLFEFWLDMQTKAYRESTEAGEADPLSTR